jgi:hypothetical protein
MSNKATRKFTHQLLSTVVKIWIGTLSVMFVVGLVSVITHLVNGATSHYGF